MGHTPSVYKTTRPYGVSSIPMIGSFGAEGCETELSQTPLSGLEKAECIAAAAQIKRLRLGAAKCRLRRGPQRTSP